MFNTVNNFVFVDGYFSSRIFEITRWTWDLRAVNEVHLSRLGVSPLADWVLSILAVLFILKVGLIHVTKFWQFCVIYTLLYIFKLEMELTF